MRNTTPTTWCDSHLPTIPESSGLLTAVWACEPHEFAAFSASKRVRQPGTYIVSNGMGEHYVGSSGNVRSRTTPYLHGVLKPARIIAIVGNGRLLHEAEARALERIIIQALWPTAKYDANRKEAYGGRVSLEQYCRLHAAWSCLGTALRPVHPDVARPWIGPEYCHLPPPDNGSAFFGGRRIAKRKGVTASIVSTGRGYIIEPGSFIRKEPSDPRHLLAFTIRMESEFAGVLVQRDNQLRLTRPVYRDTLASCSKFVFDTTDAAAWQPVEEDYEMSMTRSGGL